MVRRLGCALFVVALTVVTSACAKGDDKPSGFPAAPTATSTTLAATTGDQCLVGHWRAQETTINIGVLSPLTGGASAILTIDANARGTLDYGTGTEWRGTAEDEPTIITKRGTETFAVSGASGVLQIDDGDISKVFATQRFQVGQPLVIQLHFRASARAYTCDASTLTITNDPPDPPDVYLRES